MKKIRYSCLLFISFLLLCAPLSATTDVIVKTARKVPPFNLHVPWEINLGDDGVIEAKVLHQMGFIFVEVYINQQGPFRFLLDTGADFSIVSLELIKKLNLKPIETKRRVIRTAFSKAEIDTSLFIIEEIKIGDGKINGAPFIASNTAADDFQMLEDLDIIGILGANLFHDMVLTVNLPEGKISLTTHEKADFKGDKVPFDKKYSLPMISSKVQRQKESTEYRFLIDSGYNGFVKMPICFPKKKLEEGHQPVAVYNVANESESGFISELDGNMYIGSKELDHPLVKYTIGDCKAQAEWGLIGTQYLKYQPISIDMRNRVVIVH